MPHFIGTSKASIYFPVLHKRRCDEKTDIGNCGDNCGAHIRVQQLIDMYLGNIGTFLEQQWGYQQRTSASETLKDAELCRQTDGMVCLMPQVCCSIYVI